jgi:hypothetical protein
VAGSAAGATLFTDALAVDAAEDFTAFAGTAFRDAAVLGGK